VRLRIATFCIEDMEMSPKSNTVNQIGLTAY
jgi:hypothetical protein